MWQMDTPCISDSGIRDNRIYIDTAVLHIDLELFGRQFVWALLCDLQRDLLNSMKGEYIMDFTGKVAIVTGSAKGIGKMCAVKLAEHGAKVAIVDIDIETAEKTAAEICSSGAVAKAYRVDMSQVSEIKALIPKVVADLGGVHILINNAGILHSTPIEEITEKEWDIISAINLKGVFFAVQSVVPIFKKQRYGKIVNMASLAGRNGGFANGLAYSATKAGIIGMTKGLATRLAQWNINANSVCPGTTATDIIKQFTPDKIKELESKIPLGRLGTVEEIANSVCFLCSDEASFVTGVSMDANGGMYIG